MGATQRSPTAPILAAGVASARTDMPRRWPCAIPAFWSHRGNIAVQSSSGSSRQFFGGDANTAAAICSGSSGMRAGGGSARCISNTAVPIRAWRPKRRSRIVDRDNAIAESPRSRQRFGSIRSASPRAGSMPSDPLGIAADEPSHGRIRCSKHLLQNGSTFARRRCDQRKCPLSQSVKGARISAKRLAAGIGGVKSRRD